MARLVTTTCGPIWCASFCKRIRTRRGFHRALTLDTEKDWAPPRVVVLGDSHGIMWSPAICEITEKLGLKTAFWSVEGVETAVTFPVRSTQAMQGMTPAEKAAYDVSRLDLINQWPPDLVILVLSVRRYPHGPA